MGYRAQLDSLLRTPRSVPLRVVLLQHSPLADVAQRATSPRAEWRDVAAELGAFPERPLRSNSMALLFGQGDSGASQPRSLWSRLGLGGAAGSRPPGD